MAKKITNRSITPAKGLDDTAGKGKDRPVKTPYAETLSKLAPHIKMHMEELFSNEEQILKQLRDPKQMNLLMKDPVQFFGKAKIEISPLLKKRMAAFNLEEQFAAQGFVLPNGQIMNPNIKITIKEK
ncbi:hypothetical protein D3C71_139800 [compost metagenome]